jgi:hypothetical protein
MPSPASASLVALLAVSSALVQTAATCACDSATVFSGARRLLPKRRQHSAPEVKFLPAKVKGLSYVRPGGVPNRITSLGQQAEEDPECRSDQVHIGLGNDLGSVIISFATYSLNNSDSIVYYSDNEQAVLGTGSSSALKMASGTFRTHSEQIYVTGNLIDPGMGEPLESGQTIINLEDTSKWAYDKTTGEPWANFYNVTTVQYGLGRYNNPYMYYDSPVLRTVSISNLKPLTTYYYRVHGSCKVFRFTMPPFYFAGQAPPPSMYPFVLGVVGDIGQTEVSLKSMEALVELNPGAIVLVGDLSYAGVILCC